MDQRRPAIKMTHDNPQHPVDDARDTPPPSSGHRAQVLDHDETIGLVSVLFYAQQAAVEAAAFISDAEDANDEELTQFLETSRRESLARVEQAKRLLLARLQAEAEDATRRALHQAPHGRNPDVVPSLASSPWNADLYK